MRSAASALAFVFASVIASLLLGAVFHGLSTPLAVAGLGLGIFAGAVAWRTTPEEKRAPLGLWDLLVLGVFVLVSLRAFLWVVFYRGDEICVLSPNNLGDMSLHFNFIRNFASGVPFWPENPILSGAPLTYPLGADLFNSLLEICGVEIRRGLVWAGLGGAALTGFALWRWGGAFGVAAFLFNGGLAGFAVLATWQAGDFQQDLTWKNLFLSMFVTQRGLLAALPAGLLLLTAWREAHFRSGRRILPDWLQVLLYAGMPLFNIHAFLFLSFILAAIFLVRAPARRPLLALVAVAFVPATLGMLAVTNCFSAGSGIRWIPNWIAGETDWLAAFGSWCPPFLAGTALPWIWNFGFALPLAVAAAVVAIRNQDAEARCFVAAALVVFAACSVVAFAPWPWDNMKLMIWSWIVLAPYLWSLVLSRLELAARTALCFALFFSGAVSLAGGLDARHGYAIGQRSEVDAWRTATAEISPESRFACVPDYNHPLILLGRRVACGYEGHLWSHGLDFREKLSLLRLTLAGRSNWRKSARTLDIEWLALRTKDAANCPPPGDPPPPGARGALYDLRPLLTQSPTNPEHPRLPQRSVD